MGVVMYVAAILAGVIHVLFFVMESLLWTKPKIRENFGLSEQDAQTTKLLAYNQGFYNLFLAIGTFAGLGLSFGGLAPASIFRVRRDECQSPGGRLPD